MKNNKQTDVSRDASLFPFRVGFGYDIHKLVKGRKLFIGGIEIPSPFGPLAHSDGDVLIHAIIDALLGGAALGDIGTHFPPSDSRWKNISSRELLQRTRGLLTKNNFAVINLDSTVILEKPKLLPHIPKMRRLLADEINIDINYISIKGKTKEKCDAAGAGEAIEAYATVLITETMEQADGPRDVEE